MGKKIKIHESLDIKVNVCQQKNPNKINMNAQGLKRIYLFIYLFSIIILR